MFGQKGNEFD